MTIRWLLLLIACALVGFWVPLLLVAALTFVLGCPACVSW
jgi:hypothetical protein